MFVGGGSKQGDAGQPRRAAGGGRGEERIKPASGQNGQVSPATGELYRKMKGRQRAALETTASPEHVEANSYYEPEAVYFRSRIIQLDTLRYF